MGKHIEFEGRPVWAEVSKGALVHNLRAIRRQIGPKRKILAIVKGNAYGHGSVHVARTCERNGADWLAVTCTGEGIELRDAGLRKPILVLTGIWPGEERRLVDYRLTPTVARIDQLKLIERAAARARKKINFHLKIDSGMNRLGISPEETGAFIEALADCPHLRLIGTFTHLASSEVFTTSQTDDQVRRFYGAVEQLRAAGVDPGMLHLANSAAIAARQDLLGNMVRPGIMLYGYHSGFDPASRKAEAEAKMPLRPVLSLRARIISLRDVPPGNGVGYGARFVTERPSRIAVLAAGYADGIVRYRTNRGCVLVRGRRVPLVGTISMDLAMVDVTDLPDAQVGDVATIYGADGSAFIGVSEVARELGTVSSDLMTAIGRRVPRFLVS